jgi:hypothetical protein
MAAEQPSTNSATPLLHSQLDLPIRKVPITAFVITDDCESLWMRVNRICDQYIQNLSPTPAGSRKCYGIGSDHGLFGGAKNGL